MSAPQELALDGRAKATLRPQGAQSLPIKRGLISAGVVIAFLLGWEALTVGLSVSPLVLPRPSAILAAAYWLATQPWFAQHFLVTVSEILAGFGIAIVFGVVMGAVITKSNFAEYALSPFLIGSQVTPKVALMPLFLLWFGFGLQSKIFMVALLSFFPILKNTILGFRSIAALQQELFDVIGASPTKRIISLEIPAILPFVLTGIETASVLAVTGAIVGEYLGGNQGLGALVVMTLNALKIDQMFGTIVILICFGLVFYTSVTSLRRILIRYPGGNREDA